MAVASERFDARFWSQVLDLTTNTHPDVLDDLLLRDKDFKTGAEPACPLDVAARQELLADHRLPWPSFKVIVRLAQKERPASADALRARSGASVAWASYGKRWTSAFWRSRMIKAFSVLSKAWEPCQIAAGRLRNHKNRLIQLLEDAEQSSGALAEMIASGADQLQPVRRYIEETRQTVAHDLRSAGEALRSLGEIVLTIKDAYDDMDADLRMLERVDQAQSELGEEWTRKLRALFGYGGPSFVDRVAPFGRLVRPLHPRTTWGRPLAVPDAAAFPRRSAPPVRACRATTGTDR